MFKDSIQLLRGQSFVIHDGSIIDSRKWCREVQRWFTIVSNNAQEIRYSGLEECMLVGDANKLGGA